MSVSGIASEFLVLLRMELMYIFVKSLLVLSPKFFTSSCCYHCSWKSSFPQTETKKQENDQLLSTWLSSDKQLTVTRGGLCSKTLAYSNTISVSVHLKSKVLVTFGEQQLLFFFFLFFPLWFFFFTNIYSSGKKVKFAVNIAKFLRTPFLRTPHLFEEHLGTAASDLSFTSDEAKLLSEVTVFLKTFVLSILALKVNFLLAIKGNL